MGNFPLNLDQLKVNDASTQDPVLEFIHRRFPKDSNWTNGNCYWFARILQGRFPGGVIVHEPIVGHFLYLYNGIYYDWTGKYTGDVSKATDFTEEIGSGWFHSLVKNCIM